ncbi:MAG: hypothetical protein IE937_12150 [Gammaproteobacteria bacterium]|jgi:hypothetical protein|nr:hypothetical protein [Gammaproteobacteria bacterium]
MKPVLFRWIAIPVFGATTLLLTGCENPELKKCIDQQSALWNSSSKDPNANKPYWAAVDRCKAKYD